MESDNIVLICASSGLENAMIHMYLNHNAVLFKFIVMHSIARHLLPTTYSSALDRVC
jgi:hypothetical protein